MFQHIAVIRTYNISITIAWAEAPRLNPKKMKDFSITITFFNIKNLELTEVKYEKLYTINSILSIILTIK